VLLAKTAYTQQQPTAIAEQCVLAFAIGFGCLFVVA
jgi:hypothetical protein